MSAHADDLRHWYAEHIGPSIVLAGVGDGAAVPAPKLPPGRYLVHTMDVAAAGQLWIQQSAYDDDAGAPLKAAVAAAPSTPIDLTEDTREKYRTMAKPAGTGQGAARKATDGLSFITDAGTVTVVITRISREG
jgi:hypothetical protein